MKLNNSCSFPFLNSNYGKKKTISVKHFINKNITGEYLNKQFSYPLYCRIIYKLKSFVIKSKIDGYFFSLRDAYNIHSVPMQEEISEITRIMKNEFEDKNIESKFVTYGSIRQFYKVSKHNLTSKIKDILHKYKSLQISEEIAIKKIYLLKKNKYII